MPEGAEFERRKLNVFLPSLFPEHSGSSAMAWRCCFFRDDGSMCPLFVWAGKTHALPFAFDRRMSRIGLYAGRHGDLATGVIRFPVLDFQFAIGHGLSSQSEALFRAQAAIEQNGRNVPK